MKCSFNWRGIRCRWLLLATKYIWKLYQFPLFIGVFNKNTQ